MTSLGTGGEQTERQQNQVVRAGKAVLLRSGLIAFDRLYRQDCLRHRLCRAYGAVRLRI